MAKLTLRSWSKRDSWYGFLFRPGEFTKLMAAATANVACAAWITEHAEPNRSWKSASPSTMQVGVSGGVKISCTLNVDTVIQYDTVPAHHGLTADFRKASPQLAGHGRRAEGNCAE
eukprot:3640591-Alexandrium_andersonii.AAC.1